MAKVKTNPRQDYVVARMEMEDAIFEAGNKFMKATGKRVTINVHAEPWIAPAPPLEPGDL